MEQEIAKFIKVIAKARKAKGLPDLHHYDLQQYCEVIINLSSILHKFYELECSCRIDLLDTEEEEDTEHMSTKIYVKLEKFIKEYLGLNVMHNCDPRGAPVSIEVGEALGNSWADRNYYCVPTFHENQFL